MKYGIGAALVMIAIAAGCVKSTKAPEGILFRTTWPSSGRTQKSSCSPARTGWPRWPSTPISRAGS